MLSAPGDPKQSPIQVLSWPNAAYLLCLNENWFIQHGSAPLAIEYRNTYQFYEICILFRIFGPTADRYAREKKEGIELLSKEKARAEGKTPT